MSGGQACRTIEETRKATFHAEVRGLCGGLASEPPPSSGRSEATTQPYTDAYADTLAAPAPFASDKPHWCVDTGASMATMTTFELWESLERGEVLAWMRVWREGMECWTPVGEIAEFAWALAATTEGASQPEALPDPEPPALAHSGPLSTRSVTPEPPPPESTIRPVRRPLPGARWVALGSAVAVAAVVSALFVRRSAPPKAPLASAGAATPVEAPPLAPPPPELRAPESAHHDERGQRRLPRAGRRAYGR